MACRSQPPPSADELRAHLADRLPYAFIPSSFVAVDDLPVTPSGKIDRKALPPPPPPPPPVEPETDLERRIAEVWQELLHTDAVGIQHNFFELGAHSLMLVRAQALLEERLERSVPLVALFRYPTVAQLAKYVAGDAAPDAAASVRAEARLAATEQRERLRQRRQQRHRK